LKGSRKQEAGSRKIKGIYLASCFLLLASISCGSAELDTGEDYGNILESPEGLILTEEEHTGGWGRVDCNTCHNLDNIHLENRTDIDIDIEAIHDQAVEEGNGGCSACHGSNGT
jgi:hypothetical protein